MADNTNILIASSGIEAVYHFIYCIVTDRYFTNDIDFYLIIG
jgi:hypothetical protein